MLLSAIAALATTAELTVELLAKTSLPGDLEVDRTLVGGLSGLTYDPGCDLFYALSDDRGRIDPPRFYSLKVRFDGDAAEAMVLGATLFRDADGAPFVRGDLDPEGLALTADGTLFLASEGVPHRGIDPLVGRFGLDGSINRTLDLPGHYLPDPDRQRGVRDNHGFEGLSLTPDGGTLFVATESALLQDGPAASLNNGSLARLLRFDVADGQVVGEYLYPVEPIPDVPEPATAYASTGVSEIVALDVHTVLFVERSFSAGVGNRVRLYLVDLESAPDIRGIASVRGVADAESLLMPKKLFADLHDLGVDPDNIEGLALGPTLDDGRRLLVMVSDNNFQPSVQDNQVLLFAISGVAPPVVIRPEVGIHEIQGAGHVSPLVGRCVSRVEGLVTAILGSRSGQAFWMQNPVGDKNPSTSEGLFVMTPQGLPEVEVGNRIRVEGRVEERGWGFELPVTRLVATALEIDDRPREIPPPVVIGEGGVTIPQPEVASTGLESFDPARFAADAFETLEGMVVRVEESVVVGPTSPKRTNRGGVRLLEENVNPQRIVIDDRLVADPPDLRVGDRLAGPVEGILHYTFGSYKVLNTSPLPEARSDGLKGERTTLTGDDRSLTAATLNVENLSAVSEGDKFAHLAAIVANNLGSPDIVVVQEIEDDTGPENDGTVTAERTLELLVEAIESAGGLRYETRSIDPEDNADGGHPGANIRNAFLYNPDRVEFIDRKNCPYDFGVAVDEGPVLTCSPGVVDPSSSAFRSGEEGRGGSRKPLVGEFRFAGKPVILVNLHLRSKGGDDPIFGRRQPRIEESSQRRTEQARVVGQFIESLLEIDPDARVVVLGDLNDFENSHPLQVLEEAGLEDLVKRLPLESRYSYVYLGNSQVLDHILVSEALAVGAEVEMVHVNADLPASDRASDHDPVIVRLSMGR
jgi:endonuclease/exonuclease/phosphatase family metal-dependent hydrolase